MFLGLIFLTLLVSGCEQEARFPEEGGSVYLGGICQPTTWRLEEKACAQRSALLDKHRYNLFGEKARSMSDYNKEFLGTLSCEDQTVLKQALDVNCHPNSVHVFETWEDDRPVSATAHDYFADWHCQGKFLRIRLGGEVLSYGD